jgi:hypothetical protein
MSERRPKPEYHAVVASHIPGRLRVRMCRDCRQPQVLHHIQQGLGDCQGIQGVEVNPAAGSVTVQYDALRYPEDSIFGLLTDLDVLLGTMLNAPHIDAPAAGPGQSQAAVTLASALDDLDHRVSALTGRRLNLRVLFPLGLAGVGLWQLLKNGLMLETAPSWLLLWLAFDAFVKLHPHDASPVATVGEAQTPG